MWPIAPNESDLKPEQVVGRDDFVADLLTRLTTGSVRIADPRRMGKTVALKLLASYSTDEAPIVFCTVQGMKTVDAIVLKIAEALALPLTPVERVTDAIRGFFDAGELNAGVVKFEATFTNTDATTKLEQMLARLSGKFPDGRLTIAVDELPWAINNIVNGADPENQGPAVANAFLQDLQRLRVTYPDIRWVLAGSIGFHHVLRRANATNAVLAGTTVENCGPLRHDHSQELVRRLLASQGIASPPSDVVDAVAQASGGIAFIAHHLVDLLSQEETIETAAVERAFQAFIFDRDRSADLTHLLQRLPTYMVDEDAQLAQEILDLCATEGPVAFGRLVKQTGVHRDIALTVAHWLVDDHYLVESEDGFGWRYDVLRKVWIARRHLGGES